MEAGPASLQQRSGSLPCNEAPLGLMDTVYPEPLSRLHAAQHQLLCRRAVRKNKGRRGPACARYRTQPVTFAEIQEVDEESVEDGMLGDQVGSDRSNTRSEQDLKAQFSAFLRAQQAAREESSSSTNDTDSRQSRPL